MAAHTKAENRHNAAVKTARKVEIWKRYCLSEEEYDQIRGEEHRLSKNKVHCSCPICAFNGTTRQEYMQLVKTDYSESDLLDVDDADIEAVFSKKNRHTSRKKKFA